LGRTCGYGLRNAVAINFAHREPAGYDNSGHSLADGGEVATRVDRRRIDRLLSVARNFTAPNR